MLAGTFSQTLRPAKVVVVVPQGDEQSSAAARSFAELLPLDVVIAAHPGHVQALNLGLSIIQSPLVAITDDDAQPHPDWLERISAHFCDPSVGAVGGRDIVYWAGELVGGKARTVGKIRWYGRVVGNHHLESQVQDVEFLKGANMSYRRELLPVFDEHLAGDGSQVGNDMQASLRVHLSGWRIVWDPHVTVDHYPAERLDEDKRGAPTRRAVTNVVHNRTYILLSSLVGWRRLAAFAYPIIVGARDTPGLLLLFRATLRRAPMRRSLVGFRANLQGSVLGLITFWRTRGEPNSL